MARVVDQDGRFIAWCGVCDTARTRARGLLGVTSMTTDECILLIPCKSVHTARMKMSIDTAFLDRSLRVVAVREDLKPGRFLVSRSFLRTHSILEAAAGAFGEWGLRPGDQLALEPA